MHQLGRMGGLTGGAVGIATGDYILSFSGDRRIAPHLTPWRWFCDGADVGSVYSGIPACFRVMITVSWAVGRACDAALTQGVSHEEGRD
jgi:hypothetical protein